MGNIAFVFTGTSSSGKSTMAAMASKEYSLPIFAVGGFTRDLARLSGYSDVVEFERDLGLKKTYFDQIPKMLSSIEEFSKGRSIILEGVYDSNLYVQISALFDRSVVITISSPRHLRISFNAKRLGVDKKEAEKNLRSLEHQKKLVGRDEFCKNYDIAIRNSGSLLDSYAKLKLAIEGIMRTERELQIA